MARVRDLIAGLISPRNLTRSLAMVAAMVALFLLFQVYFLAPRQRQIASARNQADALTREIGALQALVSDKQARAQREGQVLEAFRRLSARSEQAKRMLPTREGLGILLRDLTEPGKKLGVKVVSFQPLPPVALARLTKLPFKLQAEGGFRDLGRYLAALENMDRLVVVENVQVNALDGSGSRVTAEIFGTTYLFKEGSL
jgi:type IV pilus assembly protein PilO